MIIRKCLDLFLDDGLRQLIRGCQERKSLHGPQLMPLVPSSFAPNRSYTRLASKHRLIIIRLYIFMWTNLNHFCYESFLLNCYQTCMTLPCIPFSYHPYTCVDNSQQNQEPSASAQKSYRENEVEIEQKSPRKVRESRKKKVERGRYMLKKEREDNFERKKQKKDRNLPSNIFKYFVSYLYRHPHPQVILQSGDSPQASTLVLSCISKMKQHIQGCQSYIRPALIESMSRTNLLGEHEARIFRTLFKRFIECEFRLIISMLKKLTKKEKVAYFRMGRKFVKKFTGEL